MYPNEPINRSVRRPKPVNEPETDKSENQIRDADADRLQQRGLRAQSGKFKDARREIENRIDARKVG